MEAVRQPDVEEVPKVWVRLAVYIVEAPHRREVALHLCTLSYPHRFHSWPASEKHAYYENHFNRTLPQWLHDVCDHDDISEDMVDAILRVGEILAAADPPKWGSYDGVPAMGMQERVKFWVDLFDRAMAEVDAIAAVKLDALKARPPGLQLSGMKRNRV